MDMENIQQIDRHAIDGFKNQQPIQQHGQCRNIVPNGHPQIYRCSFKYSPVTH